MSLDQLKAAFQAEGLDLEREAALARAKIDRRLASVQAKAGEILPMRGSRDTRERKSARPSPNAGQEKPGFRMAAFDGKTAIHQSDSPSDERPIVDFETLDVPEGRITFLDDSTSVFVRFSEGVAPSVLQLGANEFPLRVSERDPELHIVEGLGCVEADTFVVKHIEAPEQFPIRWK